MSLSLSSFLLSLSLMFLIHILLIGRSYSAEAVQHPTEPNSPAAYITMLLFWLILTGVVGFLLGIAVVLAIQRNVFAPPSEPNKLLPPQSETATTPLVQSDLPVAVELPEVRIKQ